MGRHLMTEAQLTVFSLLVAQEIFHVLQEGARQTGAYYPTVVVPVPVEVSELLPRFSIFLPTKTAYSI